MTVLVSDSFNRANTTASTTGLGTTDSYNGGTAKQWLSIKSGTGKINNNQANITSVDSGQVVNAGVSDASVQVVFAQTTNNPQLLFRGDTTANTYFYVEGQASACKLYKYTGSFISIGSYTHTLAVNDVIKVTVQGSSITVYVNGVSAITAIDTFNQTATNFGVSSGGGNAFFDNFEVDDLNTGQTTTYVGGGSITSAASLTSASHIVLSDGRSINGNSSLTGGEIFSYAANGNLSGQSNMASNEDMFFRASGTLQSVSILGSSDAYIGASGTRYSGMGNILSLSSLSSGEIEKYSGLGSILSFASLSGNAGLVIKEKGDIQAVSIPGNTIVNAFFHAHGDINTVSFLTSGELINGMRGSQQFEDSGIILMHTGLLSHEELIHFAFPLYHGEEIHINGIRKLNLYIIGKQENTIYLKGVRK